MLLFSAIRYNVGWDYVNYVDLIEGKLGETTFMRIEWLSRWLMEFSRSIDFTQFYFAINSVIGMFCVYKMVTKYSCDPAISLYTFLTFSLFYLMTMNIIRNFTAVLMIMYACSLFLQRRYIWYVIVVFLATGMHSSAYIGFLIPIIYFFGKGRNFGVILFVGSFFFTEIIMRCILSFGEGNLLLEKAIFYIINDDGDGDGDGKLYQYLIYFINTVFLIYWNKLVRVDPLNKFWLNLVNFGACFWILFSFQATLSFRLSLFFLVYLIILVPALINVFEIKYRKIIKQAAMVLFMMLFFVNLYILASAYNAGIIEQASFLPYNVFFLK